MRAVDDNDGLLMTPRRHVLVELDLNNHAVITLKTRLLSEAVQSCLEDENWQCGLYQGEQCKIMRPTPFEIWEPLIHTGTTRYQDNKGCLLAIDNKVMAEGLGNMATIVLGGQQTFVRVVKLRRNMPMMYRHIIPFTGEMHFAAHFFHAAWRLHHGPPLSFFAGRLQMRYLKEDWTVKS